MEEGGYHRGDEQRPHPGGGLLGLLFSVLGLLFFSLVLGRPEQREGGGSEAQQEAAEERRFRRQAIQGWLIVTGISLAFVLYGFFAFFMIGDKGPPEWDFGAIEDIPGQSVYSTYPYRGRVPAPEPQHVDRRPSRVETGSGTSTAEEGKGTAEKGRGKTEEGRR